MNSEQFIERKPNPRQKANIFSLLSFFYTIKLFIKGYTKGLVNEDIYEILPSFLSKNLASKLEETWQREEKKKLTPSIRYVLWATFGKHCVVFGLVKMTAVLIKTYWLPKATSKVISYFSDQSTLTKQDVIFYVSVVIIINILMLFVTYNIRLMLSFVGLRAKAAVSALLYRKSLRLSSESLSEVTVGKVITIVTKDTDIFEMFPHTFTNIWISMLQTCFIFYLVYQKIGTAALPGIGFFFTMLPIQIIIAIKAYKLKLKCNKKTDERLEEIKEMLSAVKIIKMYTWEKFFETKINTSRKTELEKLHKVYYTKVWISTIGSLCSKTAFFIFLMTYLWYGNNLEAEIVYYILSMCNDLEGSLSNDIPLGFSHFAEVCATTKRIQSVLETPELSRSQENRSSQPLICFRRVTTKILDIPALSINGGLNIVIGHVGCGKSTFLRMILHECKFTGEIEVRGSVSYASQEPWLFPSTIRNNILFGETYDEKRYQEILKVCCLDYDMKFLPEGDSTLVGDRGINLSRGQQARVNLARAIYKDSDIYLLDDCLASLDGHVSDSIYKKCICEFLANKLCIFVTNNLTYIRNDIKVIEIDSGLVKIKEESKIQSVVTVGDKIEDNEEVGMYTKKQIYQENKKSGVVPMKYYIKYLKYGGGFFVFGFIVGLFVAAQFISNYSEKILSQWVTASQNISNFELYKESKMFLYVSVVVTSIILTLIKSFAFYIFIRTGCINIHKAMIKGVINSTMTFFDTHFIGNTMTRFTKDCLSLDETLPFVIMDCLSVMFTVFGGIILLTTVDYVFLIESLLLLIVAIFLKQFCQPTGRNLERLHVMARSPINGHLNCTLEGLISIRAYKTQAILTDEFDNHQNLASSGIVMCVTSYSALNFFLNLLCQIFTSWIILQFFIFNTDSVSVGDAGLVITQAMTITNVISRGILNIADCENLMISVERALEMTETQQEEKEGDILTDWPQSGLICFNDVSLSYDNFQNEMLKNINCLISPGEKLGIVGRTGAGKSSLISALFRLYQTKGVITIDGKNIKEINLQRLRSSITIIPQDPYLFSGTIRENLDPLQQYQDEDIWKILDELKLKSLIKDLTSRIDKGSNFSSGQKQLLCLTRAILRNNKIVILDEATANVDDETDALIRDTIKKHFYNSTLIIIAHRSSVIMDCDRIIVIDNGQISESDTPVNLMLNKNR